MKQEVLDFYNQNKDCVYVPPKLPKELNTIDAARWITNHPKFAWLQLDIDIPDIAHECSAAEKYYVPHRGGASNGWNSCCIHGIRTDTTQTWSEYVTAETDTTYKWTELSNEVPHTTQFWKSFPTEKFKRVRYMQLEPNGYIAPHSDTPGQYEPGEPVDYDPLELGCPINVAIIHPDNCYMVLEKFGIVPFKPNTAFLINIRHTHAVVNFSNDKRIHMIGFCVPGNRKEEFAKLIVRSYERNQI